MNTTKGINELISDFLSEVDCRPNTVANYKLTLSIWRDWMVQNADIRNPKKGDLLRYKNYLIDERKLKHTSVDSYVASLRLFFKFLSAKEISDNITLGVKLTNKNIYFKRGSLKPDQVVKMLELMPRTTLIQRRNFAIVNLMVRTGLRCIEVVRMDICDMIDKSNGRAIRLQRKGRNEKDAVIMVPDSVTDPIVDYISYRDNFKDNDPMFISHDKQTDHRIQYKTVSRLVIDAIRSSGIDDKSMTAHSLRHTAAITAITSGAQLYDVQQMLGHRSPETTMRYIRELERENNQATNAINAIANAYQMPQKPFTNALN